MTRDVGHGIPLPATPDRVVLLYDAKGKEVYRVEAVDATPDTTIEFKKQLKVSAIQILAAGEVYA